MATMTCDNLNWSLEYYEQNMEQCNEILKLSENLDKIPLINSTQLQNLCDGILVKFEGMVQDMLNPEYYSCSYKIINKENNETCMRPGKFRDLTFVKENEKLEMQDSTFKERLVFFCIPLPGTNHWVEDYKKRQSCYGKLNFENSGLKRNVNSVEEELKTESAPSTSQSNFKKLKTDEQEKIIGKQSQMYSNSKYFPLSQENGLPCIVKVYEEEEKSNIVLNDRIEVIGFLSLHPALEANWEDSDVEDKAIHPPPSLVPRIHAILIKKLNHFNPLLKQIIQYDKISHLIENARSDLHLILTQLLFEDTLAADYLLCNLLSKIYVRNDNHTIGKLSLNLCNINVKNFGFCLNEILKTLVTNSHYVSLTTDFLNQTSFIPKKDYESNRLCSGLLQLCDDVHLILDETKMNEGQLNNVGCLNVAALQRLFRSQEVHYDFGYYSVPYSTNIPLLVLSEGKSMLEADIYLKVKSESYSESHLNESFEAVKLYLNEEVANKIRIYLSSIRLQNFEMGEEMVKKIGEDYVLMRQQNKLINSSDLHTLLILSRLLALSHRRTMLSSEDWIRAVEMEAERKLRSR